MLASCKEKRSGSRQDFRFYKLSLQKAEILGEFRYQSSYPCKKPKFLANSATNPALSLHYHYSAQARTLAEEYHEQYTGRNWSFLEPGDALATTGC